MDVATIAALKTESKKTARKPTAKVHITWAGRAVDNAHVYVAPAENRASFRGQVAHGIGSQRRWAFCETNAISESVARLGDDICVMPDAAEVGEGAAGYLIGWWGNGSNITNANRRFAVPQVLQVRFAPITILGFRLHGYLAGNDYAEWPVDFDVIAHKTDGNGYAIHTYADNTPAIVEVRGNTLTNYQGSFSEPLRDVTQLEFKIYSWSRRGAFVKITAAFDDFMRKHNADDIMSMSILEEAEGSVGTLPIGNISCNELDLTLQNIDDTFAIGNTASILSGQARSNRRIEPFIGFAIHDDCGQPVFDENGQPLVEYAPKGVYWSRDWSIPLQGTGASTSALDRLGLLQEVEYNGIGNINNPDAVAEESYWINKSLYAVAEAVLHDLRVTYMDDLEYAIDNALKSIIVPLAFFKSQSYFNVIKAIAQAATAYAFMDTPTHGELAAARERGNMACADILRIQKLEHLYPVDGDIVPSHVLGRAEKITLDDIIEQSIQPRRADMVNVVTVPWEACELVNGIPKQPDDSEVQHVTVSNNRAILEYGRLEHQYDHNNLIQAEPQARAIAEGILKAFSGTQRVGEMRVFGDVTTRVGDIWNVPEYVKHGIDNRGIYSVTRLQTEYDGSLRQSATCRRVGDAPPDSSDLGLYWEENIIINPNVIDSNLGLHWREYLILIPQIAETDLGLYWEETVI